MTQVMTGVRILEVAEHTFVPAASALLADLGAEVIKIEHVERGDAMRGLASSGTIPIPGNVHALLEHSNRGKQSLALDLLAPEGLEVLYKIAATCDVFLTNKLPSVRTKLKIDLEDLRPHNPKLIYVRGTGQGERGPDADKGSYDNLSFWHRAGVSAALSVPGGDDLSPPPGPAFGDSIGAMTIAGGIMGALYHRAVTGEAPVVDVSLLASGMWAMGAGIALSATMQQPFVMATGGNPRQNPLVSNYQTKDHKWLALCCLQAGKYWPDFAAVTGHPELATDPRFASHELLLENSPAAKAAVQAVLAERTLEEWRVVLDAFSGQWTAVQNTLEVMQDPQTVANGYMQPCATAAGDPFVLVAPPIQYDEEPAPAHRAPEFNEHGDQILQSIGLDWDAIIDLKVKGVVA